MRISDNMTNQMAKQSGLPIYGSSMADGSDNTLLSALNKKSSSIVDAFGNMQTKTDYRTLSKSADNLSDVSKNILNDETFEDADKLAETVKKLAENFNKMLSGLKECPSALNDFYYAEMKKAAEQEQDEFEKFGISFDKNGKMTVDEKTLKSADPVETKNSLKPFAEKTSFLSERIKNAVQAEEESISNRYDASGNLYFGHGNTYDFWG